MQGFESCAYVTAQGRKLIELVKYGSKERLPKSHIRNGHHILQVKLVKEDCMNYIDMPAFTLSGSYG